MDRFKQISPKLIFAADGYHFNGKAFDRTNDLKKIVDAVPSIEHVVWYDNIGLGSKPDFKKAAILPWSKLVSTIPPSAKDFEYTRVPFDHPLWILFSSGTTGLPKAIVHSHVGILVEQYKAGALHCNMTDKSVMFFYTTTGWMMWNALMIAPLLGGAAVLYEGSPTYPQNDTLWKLAETAKVTLFGSSPTFIEIMRKEELSPNTTMSFDALESIILSGSPSTPDTFNWLYGNIKKDLWVTSQSGGTEFCSALVAGVPTLPVFAGEIQARSLGADVRVFDDDGKELIDQTGELVVVQPMPSMPIYFWGDQKFSRYHDTYFNTFDGIWRHGDLMKINQRGGAFIYGRSDSTLNRFGVRIGSGEFYSILEGVEEIDDSLIVCIEKPNSKFYMPLFVTLKEGMVLTDELTTKINSILRREGSPRHVPEEIHQVPSIPYTLTGKKMEVPVRKLLLNWAPNKSFSIDSMKDSTAMKWYVNFAQNHS